MTQRDSRQYVEVLLQAAQKHGDESEADMEVGDLQEVVRACWKTLTLSQRQEVLTQMPILMLIEEWG